MKYVYFAFAALVIFTCGIQYEKWQSNHSTPYKTGFERGWETCQEQF